MFPSPTLRLSVLDQSLVRPGARGAAGPPGRAYATHQAGLGRRELAPAGTVVAEEVLMD